MKSGTDFSTETDKLSDFMARSGGNYLIGIPRRARNRIISHIQRVIFSFVGHNWFGMDFSDSKA